MANPSSLISEALGSLSKATTLALANVEERAKTEIARANSEASDARRDRDEAINALHAIQLNERDWQRRLDGLKSSVEKSDLTIKHQTETIAQLRAEANQWKSQLMRLEDTSRQEILDWKEQYLRAEQERCRLSARLDELVAGQLLWNTHANAAIAPFTPRTPYSEAAAPSTATSASSTTTKRASTSANSMPAVSRKHLTPLSLGNDDSELPAPTSQVHKSRSRVSISKAPLSEREQTRPRTEVPQAASATHGGDITRAKKNNAFIEVQGEKNANTTRRRASNAAPRTPAGQPVTSSAVSQASQREVQSQLRQQVIRRVQAVIEVPIKQEDDEAEAYSDSSSGSGSEFVPEEPQSVKKHPTAGSRSRRVSKPLLKKGERAKAARNGAGSPAHFSEDEEDEHEEVPRAARGSRPRRVIDDDEDELLLGAESDGFLDEIPPKPKIVRGRPSKTAASPQKRKLGEDSAKNPSSRTPAAKVARTR